MPSDWTTITISDLVARGEAEIKTGPFGTQLHASDYVDEGTPVLNAGNVGFGDIRTEKLDFISAETVNRLSSHLLRSEDIVFGRKGTVERHAFIRDRHTNWFQGTDCLRLRLKSPSIEPRFVSYYFLTDYHKQWIKNQSSHGATMTSLNQAIIGRITFDLPPLPVQRKIVDVLSAYDDLIEVNARRIRVLEAMAQSVYHEWFGNADAKSLPSGWEITTLNKVSKNFDAKRVPLSSMKRAEIQGEYPYYGAAKVLDHINDYIFDGKYLLVAEDGSVITKDGKPVLQMAYGKFWVNNHTHVLQGADLVSTEYLYLCLSEVSISGYITGAAQPKINQANLNRIPVTLPPKDLLLKANKMFEDSFDMIETLNRQNANLRRTRDLLLPRLVSGEVGVEGLEIKGE